MNLNTPFTEYYDDGSIEEEGTLNRKGEKHGKAIGVVRQLPTLLKLNVKYADLFLRQISCKNAPHPHTLSVNL